MKKVLIFLLIIIIVAISIIALYRFKNKEETNSRNFSNTTLNNSGTSGTNNAVQNDTYTQKLIDQVKTGGSTTGKGTALKIDVSGTIRDYILYLPPNFNKLEKLPLVFELHGGEGDMNKMQNYSNFNDIASKHGFAVVYPNSLDGNWNDGRLNQADIKNKLGDDVGFISSLIDSLVQNAKIDPDKVYATGISNGGFMTQKLACDIGNKLTAIGPIATAVPTNYVTDCKPAKPIPIIWFQGTTDPLIPFNGGDLVTKSLFGNSTRKGTVLSSQDSLKFWMDNNGVSGSPVITQLTDLDKNDSSDITHFSYSSSRNAPIEFYKVNGGGHSVPGLIQYLPKIIIGNVNGDVKAEELIWQFFQQY
jgi:polyhydroxybutyrate depolymerase